MSGCSWVVSSGKSAPENAKCGSAAFCHLQCANSFFLCWHLLYCTWYYQQTEPAMQSDRFVFSRGYTCTAMPLRLYSFVPGFQLDFLFSAVTLCKLEIYTYWWKMGHIWLRSFRFAWEYDDNPVENASLGHSHTCTLQVNNQRSLDFLLRKWLSKYFSFTC